MIELPKVTARVSFSSLNCCYLGGAKGLERPSSMNSSAAAQGDLEDAAGDDARICD